MKFLPVIRTMLCVAIAAFGFVVTTVGALPGLTITGNTFVYDAPDGQVTGIIRIPSGSGPFPAVLIGHGKSGYSTGFSLQHANVLVNWGFVCIGPSYTHEGSTVNPPDNEGYCPENSRRARRCLEILADIPIVDMSRLALFGHSMGSFVSCGLGGEIPSQIKAACISAGGTTGTSDTSFASPATQEVQGITAPFLMFHGTADTTVLPSQSVNLQNILNGKGVPTKRLLYQGINHDIINSPVKQADIHAIMRAWFTQHGVLVFPGNSAPTLSMQAAVTVANGAASQPIAITIGDVESASGALAVQAFTTDDIRLPNSAMTMGGSGANRTLILTPPSGQTGAVEVSIVVSDGQLSTVSYLQVTIENGGQASVNHRPEISWIADQRTPPSTPISGIPFVVGDVETAPSSLVITAESSNQTLLPLAGVVFGGSGADRAITLTPAVGQTGVATITVTVSDGVKSTAGAFTLTVAATVPGNTPPLIQAVPSETIAVGTSYGSLPVIIRDSESMENSLTLVAASSNPTLVPTANIVLGGTTWGRSVQVTPAPGQSGRATITLTVSDGTNTSSTAFVLDLLGGKVAPGISGLPTVQTLEVGNAIASFSFTVTDADTAATDLRVTGTSSNPTLLPDANIGLGGSAASRTMTLAPVAGQIGAATVTLKISDGDYVRSAQVLLVVHDPTAAAAKFSRPRGVFVLDSGGPANYTTSFGSSISLRDGNIRSHGFVDGLTLRVAWSDVESGTTPGSYDFFIIQNALNKLPVGQRLSVIIVPGEPAYVASTPGVQTWNDAGTVRGTPWDGYVRERRRALLQAMGSMMTGGGVELRRDQRLDLLDPYLPGGFTGIRDPNSTPLRSLTGYTRQKLLAAVQDELRTLQDEFPGRFVQLGFWPITDLENDAYGGLSASEWLRQQLLAEFNGVIRPRVGFFMENLAAKRTGLGIEPYSGTPVTGFGSALFASRDNTSNGFQMLGSWTRPFNDGHVTNTLYGTPNDAMEFAYNTYRAEYHEVYVGDVDNSAVQPSLQRWHDFYASRVTTNPDSDEDGDGLPLWWEESHGLKPTIGRNDDGGQGDPDRDGAVNLVEFALVLDPQNAASSGLPVVSAQFDSGTQKTYMVVTHRRRVAVGTLQYIVEVSSDLGTWNSGPGHAEPFGAPIPTGDGVSEWVVVRALPAIEDGGGRLFARLRVQP